MTKHFGSFSRQEARDLIPKSNPLLQHFFDHIVGPNFDKRLEYIVNELCEVFSHADVQELMSQYFKNDLFGKTHEGPDPVIHFYEDFLKEYDADLRKKLGASSTPLASACDSLCVQLIIFLKKSSAFTAGCPIPQRQHMVSIGSRYLIRLSGQVHSLAILFVSSYERLLGPNKRSLACICA